MKIVSFFFVCFIAITQVACTQNKFEGGDPEIDKYLNDNKIKKKDVEKTASGLYYTVTEKGTDRQAQKGDFVRVHYIIKLIDGTLIQSSYDSGQPLEFTIGDGTMIAGFDQGIPLYNIGGKGTIYVPSELGWGERGGGAQIPPNADVYFEIELVSAMTAEEAQAEKLKANQAQMDTENKLIEEWLTTNNLTAQKSPDGIYYIVERQGTGAQPQTGQNVSIHYIGKLLDGYEFDQSYKRGTPLTYQLGASNIIAGWNLGIPLFNVGGKGKIIIPSPLGYGPGGNPPAKIPGNSPLVFDMEVMDAK